MWTFLQVFGSVFVATVHTAVAVVVHGAVADVVLVHQVHHVGNGFRVVGGIAVDFHIEDMAATGQIVVWCFHFSLVLRAASVIYRHVVGVGVVCLVGHARDFAEVLTVALGELAAQALGRSGENTVVVLILLRETQCTVAHVGHNLQTELLCLLAFAVVLAHEGNQTFSQTDETDAESALVDHALDGVVRLEFGSTVPQLCHEQRELLHHSGFLELEALVELLGSHFESLVEFCEEQVFAVFLIFHAHTFDGKAHNIDGAERDVATADRGLRTEAVFKHAGAATHCSDFVVVAFGIVGTPKFVLVESGVEVHEVREETASGHLARILVQVVVAVAREVAHATLLLPDLDREDGSAAVAHTLVGAAEKFADNAAAFCAGVGTVVDGAKHHLVATTGVYGVHIMDKRLHGLVHTAHGAVDGVLLRALFAREEIERLFDEVVDFGVVKAAEVAAGEGFHILHLLNIAFADEWSQIEVKRRYCLTTVHLVLRSLHRDTSNHACGFDTLGGAAFAMASHEAVFQHLVERVLHASEALGGVVVLVVDVEHIVGHSLAHFLAQQIVVDKWFGGFAGKLHHHAGRGVGVHVGVFASDVVVLGVDDFLKHVGGSGLACHITRVAIFDVGARHLLVGALHQFVFHHVLDCLHGHLAFASHTDAVGNALNERFVVVYFCCYHRLANRSLDFFFVVAYLSAVAFEYGLNHSGKCYIDRVVLFVVFCVIQAHRFAGLNYVFAKVFKAF